MLPCWEALYWQFGKKKLDAGKLGIGIRREKTSTGSLVLTIWKEKNRCLELGIGTSERKNQMLGSLPFTDQKEITRYWKAWY
jgi:hypothetical protein